MDYHGYRVAEAGELRTALDGCSFTVLSTKQLEALE
jgi:hypothetical protein